MKVGESISKSWLVIVASLVILFLVGAGALALIATWADEQEPTPAVADIRLNPTSGQPGSTVTVVGSGWQPGETVLVYLVEVESNATDGAIYASVLANRDGQIAAEFTYPEAAPWAGRQSTIVEAHGLSSRREAQALFQVSPSIGEPTTEPTTEPTARPATETPVPTSEPATATLIPPTATPTSVPRMATPRPATATPTRVPPTSTPLPKITDWRGEYYNNVHLQGGPVLVRNDRGIDFTWGTSSPAAGLPADDFSVRWTRRQHFPAGTHRFFVEVDDGARLWVDGQLVIDQWHAGPGSYSGDVYLTEGAHDVRLEMYEHLGGATARMWWSSIKNYPDWKGEYFGNRNLSGSPVLVRNDQGIDFNWGNSSPAAGLPADDFSVRWTRRQHFPAGTHRFFVEVDDGARLWIDSRLVIDRWNDGPGSFSGDIYLTEGAHDVRMEMYEHLGGARARMWWSQVKDYPDWKGEYFNNSGLQGSPVLVRNDALVDFDWGGGSPAPVVNADNFSVRWTKSVNFEAGTYRFCVQADDGVSVEMDDKRPFIREWHDGPGTYCADVYVTGGRHKTRVEYFEHTGDALVKFSWQRVADGQVSADAIRPIDADLWAAEPAFAALGSLEEYRAFVQQHGLRPGEDGDRVAPQVNWEREIVVAAFLGERQTAGYAIEVSRITYRGREVTVHLRLAQPASDSNTAQAVTSPHTVVAVRRSALPLGELTFRFVDETGRLLAQDGTGNQPLGDPNR
jgi:hypothetical protein